MPDVSLETDRDRRHERWLRRLARAAYRRWLGKTNADVREEWVASRLRSLPAGTRLLDAGAGEQYYRQYCGHLAYVSQDFARYEGAGDGTGLQTGTWRVETVDIVCDITAIPEPDASFDAVLCVEVFEHLPAPVAAIREFSRLLRPDGRLIVTAPFASLTHFAPFHFYSGFNRYFYRKWLDDAGFDIVTLHANGNYFGFLLQELLRLPRVAAGDEPRHRLGILGWLGLLMLAPALRRLSRAPSQTPELLCYGHFVEAVRRGGATVGGAYASRHTGPSGNARATGET